MRIDAPPAVQPHPPGQPGIAARFEGLFVREMVKAMRAAKLADGALDTDADQAWRDMQDQMLADTLAARAPIGVAAQLSAKPAAGPR